MKSGYETSINSAVRRRDTILATAATAAATGEAEAPLEALGTSTNTATPQTPVDGAAQATSDAALLTASLSASQKVAQAGLSGKSNDTAMSPDMSRLSAAMSHGAGVPGNPIVVTLSERPCLVISKDVSVLTITSRAATGSWIPRLVRFVLLTGLGAFCA